jgi:hypothetical protein
MRSRYAIIALAAAALGVWIAGAVAQGDYGANRCGSAPARAPKNPIGFTGTDGTGTALPGSASALAGRGRCHRGSGAGHGHHKRSGEHSRSRPEKVPRARHRPLSFTFSVRLRHGSAPGGDALLTPNGSRRTPQASALTAPESPISTSLRIAQAESLRSMPTAPVRDFCSRTTTAG